MMMVELRQSPSGAIVADDLAIVARCACGAAYTAGTWATLRHVGALLIPADDLGPAEQLELRNCTCGSTISRSL